MTWKDWLWVILGVYIALSSGWKAERAAKDDKGWLFLWEAFFFFVGVVIVANHWK